VAWRIECGVVWLDGTEFVAQRSEARVGGAAVTTGGVVLPFIGVE
jgi:hypothetical protein